MKISDLEQTGAIQLLFYLKKKKKAKIGEMVRENVGIVSQSAIYRAIPVLKKLKLIKEETLTNPPRRIFSLTEKGKRVLEKLREIEEILREE